MADFALLASQARTARAAQEWSPGDRVEVKGFDAIGTIRYYGPHKSKTRRIVYGIELDDAEGDCDGTVYGVKYFDCKDNYGVLVVPAHVKELGKNGKKKKKKKKKEQATAPAPAADNGFGGFEDAGFGGFDEGSTAAPAPPEDDMDGFGDDFEDPAPAAAAAAADPAADPAGGGGGGGGGDDEEFDEWDGFGEEEEDVYKAAASGQNIQSTNFVYSDANEMIVQAKIDFTAVETEDLSFNKGDELTAKDIGDTDWWLGKDKEGKEGMVQRKDFLVIDDGS